jgi:hypothetical protein
VYVSKFVIYTTVLGSSAKFSLQNAQQPIPREVYCKRDLISAVSWDVSKLLLEIVVFLPDRSHSPIMWWLMLVIWHFLFWSVDLFPY